MFINQSFRAECWTWSICKCSATQAEIKNKNNKGHHHHHHHKLNEASFFSNKWFVDANMTRYHGAPVRATAHTGARPWMRRIFQPLKVRRGKKRKMLLVFLYFPSAASFRYKPIQSRIFFFIWKWQHFIRTVVAFNAGPGTSVYFSSLLLKMHWRQPCILLRILLLPNSFPTVKGKSLKKGKREWKTVNTGFERIVVPCHPARVMKSCVWYADVDEIAFICLSSRAGRSLQAPFSRALILVSVTRAARTVMLSCYGKMTFKLLDSLPISL